MCEALIGEMIGIVQHVAGTLAAYGEKLRAGDVIITGSIVPPPIIEPDETEFAYALEPVGGAVGEISAVNQRQFRQIDLPPPRVLRSGTKRRGEPSREESMRKSFVAASLLAALLGISSANAQGTVKIGAHSARIRASSPTPRRRSTTASSST